MSKLVSKQCSILNYIRHVDSELHDLVQDLCIGRIFAPRRGGPGVTFLRPDKALLGQLKKLASGDNPEEAVAALQSMVLLDHLSDLGDFEDRKSDIPTFLRKKLPVASADGKKVTLKNGAEITVDSDFETRSDRGNIAVYMLSKALVPTDTEPSSGPGKGPRPKKAMGGADYSGGRQNLFARVLAQCCRKTKRNPAVEVLVSLMKYLKAKGDDNTLNLVKSQLSGDALASLAIVLQPYRNGQPTYITADTYNDWASKSQNANFDQFCYCANPIAYYVKMMNSCDCGDVSGYVQANQSALAEGVAKPTIIRDINSFYANLKEKSNNPIVKQRTASGVLAFAEAELRVLSAVLLDNSIDCLDHHEATALFTQKCTLDQPYICNNKDAINKANVGFYYSSVYLLSKSDGLFYLPGLYGSQANIGDIVKENDTMIHLVNDQPTGDDNVYNIFPSSD
jgi:hypothetical protein